MDPQWKRTPVSRRFIREEAAPIPIVARLPPHPFPYNVAATLNNYQNHYDTAYRQYQQYQHYQQQQQQQQQQHYLLLQQQQQHYLRQQQQYQHYLRQQQQLRNGASLASSRGRFYPVSVPQYKGGGGGRVCNGNGKQYSPPTSSLPSLMNCIFPCPVPPQPLLQLQQRPQNEYNNLPLSKSNGNGHQEQGKEKIVDNYLDGSAPFQFTELLPTPENSISPSGSSPTHEAQGSPSPCYKDKEREMNIKAILSGHAPFTASGTMCIIPPGTEILTPPACEINENEDKDVVHPLPSSRPRGNPISSPTRLPEMRMNSQIKSWPMLANGMGSPVLGIEQENYQDESDWRRGDEDWRCRDGDGTTTTTSSSITLINDPPESQDLPELDLHIPYFGPRTNLSGNLNPFYGRDRRVSGGRNDSCSRLIRMRSSSSSPLQLSPRSLPAAVDQHRTRLVDVQSMELNGTEKASPTTCAAVVLVYIDNSNIYINTQHYAATYLKFKSGIHKDGRVRLAIKNLLKLAAKGRKVLQARLYGSEPPPMDSVWKKIGQLGIHVTSYRRSPHHGKEKGIDTALTVDAVDDINQYKRFAKGNSNSSVILFTGDGDMQPLVRCAVKHGWNVEIWSYGGALNNELREEAAQSERIQIHDMSEVFEKIVFWNYKWVGSLPMDRTIILEFEEPDDPKKTRMEIVMKLTSQIFRVPTAGRYLNRKGGPSSHNKILAVVPTHPLNAADGSLLVDFNHQVWSKMDEVRGKLCGYVSHNTFQNWKQNEDTVDEFENGNQFEQLDLGETETDDEEDGQDEDLGFTEAVAGSAEGGDDEYDDTGYTVVSSKLRPKTQLYSDLCKFSFRCIPGKKCMYHHTEEEKNYFQEESNSETRQRYKSMECRLYLKGCLYTDKPHLCSFAHGRTEATCGKCKMQRDHYTNECVNEYRP